MNSVLVENGTVVKRYITVTIIQGKIAQLSTNCPYLLEFVEKYKHFKTNVISNLEDLTKLRVGIEFDALKEIYQVKSLVQVYNLSLSVPNTTHLHMEFIALKDRSSYITFS